MREIKFRAWDSHLEVMANDIHKLDSLNEYLSRDRQIVMQFTGLKDKNGKDIYEGDILRVGARNISLDDLISHELCQVIFSEGGFNVTFDGEDPDNFLYDYSDKYGEVIGNIHETPELIK